MTSTDEAQARAGPAWGIIVAAGRSERMGGADKLYATLMGRPLLAWSLAAFQQCGDIEGVVVVASARAQAAAEVLVRDWRFTKVRAVVAGGERRQDSVRAGIEAAVDAAIVAVHDGARPLVTPDLVAQGVALARQHGAAVCGVPPRDTVKELRGGARIIERTLTRDRVWLAQTPQVFERALLLDAHGQAEADATDDAALVEAMGREVAVYEGSASNIKVTTPVDMVAAEALLRARMQP